MFRAMRPEETEECCKLWAKVFDTSGPEFFYSHFSGNPGFKPEYTRVCEIDGSLVAAVHICERKVRVGEAELSLGGIANVGTHPDHRGKGYASRLLKDAIQVMEQAGMDVSLLFTGIHPFYAKLGWEKVEFDIHAGRINPDTTQRVSTKYAVRPVNSAADSLSIRAIYEEFNGNRTLSTVRTPEYWECWIDRRFGHGQLLVAELNCSIVGYIYYTIDGQQLSLKEIGYNQSGEDCIGPLIRHAASIALGNGADALCSFLPDEPAVSTSVNEVITNAEVSKLDPSMFRIINIESLGQRILQELKNRAATDECISLNTSVGSLPISISKSGVNIQLSQTDFLNLLFGIRDAGDLRLDLPDEQLKALDTLFPKQHPVFWQADCF